MKLSKSESIYQILPLRSKKAGRYEKLLRFARSHSIVIRGSVNNSAELFMKISEQGFKAIYKNENISEKF